MGYAWEIDDNQYEKGELLTWKSAIDLFLAAKKTDGRAEKVLYTYRNVLERIAGHAEALDPPVPLQRFGMRYMQTFLNTRRATKVGDRTVQQDVIIAKTFYTWLWREGYSPVNGLLKLKTPPIRKYVRPRIAPTSDEIKAILDGIDSFWSDVHNPRSRFRSSRAREFFRTRERAIILMMADTGMRISEVFGIKLGNIELDQLRITLEHTKNGSTREVPISHVLATEALAPWLDIREHSRANCELLFINEHGNPLNVQGWGKQLSKKVQFAGVERNITCHTFRRFASTLHDQVDRDAAKAIVGHYSNEAHRLYNVQEWRRLVTVHEKASPLAGILSQPEGDQP